MATITRPAALISTGRHASAAPPNAPAAAPASAKTIVKPMTNGTVAAMTRAAAVRPPRSRASASMPETTDR